MITDERQAALVKIPARVNVGFKFLPCRIIAEVLNLQPIAEYGVSASAAMIARRSLASRNSAIGTASE